MIRCWEVSRWSKLQRNYPRLSCVSTRRVITYECRLSTCTFSLWKKHCNVGTDAEFQRVKLDENVNESIASDMKNSNPIITKSQLSGAWIFMTAIHYHNAEPEEIRASEYRLVHLRHYMWNLNETRSRKIKKIIRGPSRLPGITIPLYDCALTEPRHGIKKRRRRKTKRRCTHIYIYEKRVENSSTRDGMTRQADGSRELKNEGGTIFSMFERIAGRTPRDFDR